MLGVGSVSEGARQEHGGKRSSRRFVLTMIVGCSTVCMYVCMLHAGAVHELRWSCMKLAYVSDGAFISQVADPRQKQALPSHLYATEKARRDIGA